MAIPHAGAEVQTPSVQLSAVLQQGFVGLHVSVVPPHSAGATHVPSHESAPLQQGTVPLHASLVLAQLAGAVHSFASQLSAGLQQGTAAQDPPVPAHSAGAVQKPPVQVALPQHAVPPAVHAAPTPRQVAGPVQTPAVQSSPVLQQGIAAHEEPVPAQGGAVQTFPVHASVASQQGRDDAHDAPVSAQLGGGSVLVLLQPASAAASAAATMSWTMPGPLRAMGLPRVPNSPEYRTRRPPSRRLVHRTAAARGGHFPTSAAGSLRGAGRARMFAAWHAPTAVGVDFAAPGPCPGRAAPRPA